MIFFFVAESFQENNIYGIEFTKRKTFQITKHCCPVKKNRFY